MANGVDTLSVVVLAGGRSTRMGRDKALLTHPTSQLPLVLHQLETARQLEPAETLVSAHAGQALPELPCSVQRVEDAGTAGPLAGIVAALEVTRTTHLAVLPVDLPWLEASIYRKLRESIPDSDRGSYATTPQGPEPLVCILPRTLLPALTHHLSAGRASPRRLFTQELKGSMQPVEFAATRPFENWNHPDDIAELKPTPPPAT